MEATFPLEMSAYQMIAIVGSGASSEVYQARCLENDRELAVKVIDLDGDGLDTEFIRQEVALWRGNRATDVIM